MLPNDLRERLEAAHERGLTYTARMAELTRRPEPLLESVNQIIVLMHVQSPIDSARSLLNVLGRIGFLFEELGEVSVDYGQNALELTNLYLEILRQLPEHFSPSDEVQATPPKESSVYDNSG